MSENNLVRFINITKRKNGIFANFRIKAVRGGVSFTSSVSVDISACEVDPADSLEKIIEVCARDAVREIKRIEVQFEGIQSV